MKKGKIIKLALSVLGVSLIVGTMVAIKVVTNQYNDLLTKVLTYVEINQEELKQNQVKTQTVVYDIQKEGTVLVKNENDVLPLNKSTNNKINIFGRSSTDWVVSGTGSGQVKSETSDDSSGMISFVKAMHNYGINVNQDLQNFYKLYQSPLGLGDILGNNSYDSFYVLSEPSISEYSSSLLNNAKAYSNTAFVVISRRAGESDDPLKYQNKLNGKAKDESRTYLEISSEEEELLTYVGANYVNVIVIINSTNTMELSFLDTIPGLDACLVVGPTGTKGATVLPGLIYGEHCPSGRLPDTYAYQLESSPSYESSSLGGSNYYTNSEGMYPTGYSINSGYSPQIGVPYLEYKEGIYVGYRYYETADYEHVFDGVNNEYGSGYSGVVQFPFGYGLSYSSFEYELLNIKNNDTDIGDNYNLSKDDKITFKVKVTNKGQYSAKEVVQLYVTTPYYLNEIEKSYVVLCAFEKTNEIKPNDSDVVELEVYLQDIASYDCYDKNNNGFKGYENDHGGYTFKIKNNSHDGLAVRYHDVDTNGEYTFSLGETAQYPFDRLTGKEVNNKYTGEDAIDGIPLDGSIYHRDIDYISRANMPLTVHKSSDVAMSQMLRDTNLYAGKSINDWARASSWDNASKDELGNNISISSEQVRFNQSNNLKIASNGVPTELGIALGQNYDDQRWDKVMEQVSINECVDMISNGIYGSNAVDSIGKPALRELDGPIQVKGFSVSPRGTGFPSTCVLAATFNKELCRQFGLRTAEEMTNLGLQGLYGPACNIHRSPLEGRNYEYYSEDPLLAGKLVSQTCLGLKQGGKYGFIKHFGFGETECERDSIYTWMSEQTLREIYFRPFQIAVTEKHATAFMTSYARIGAIWAGGSVASVQGILKNEWMFRGGIVTDWSDHNEYMLMDQALRAGGNLGMSTQLRYTYNQNSSNRIKYRLKEAVKEITYMWLNVCYENQEYAKKTEGVTANNAVTMGWVWWKPLIASIQIIGYSGAAIWTYFIIRNNIHFKKKRENETHA